MFGPFGFLLFMLIKMVMLRFKSEVIDSETGKTS
jgi:hypothetical protein